MSVLPSGVKHWSDIPAVPTAAFKEFQLTSFPVSKKRKVFVTSGTTRGTQGRHYFDTLKLYEAAIVPAFKQFVVPDRAKLSYCYLVESSKKAPESSLSYMVSVVDQHFAKGKGKHFIKGGKLQAESLYRELVSAKQSVCILATAFSLKAFLDYLIAHNLRVSLPTRSRLMSTGGFKGRVQEISRDTLYQLVKRLLGIPPSRCITEYGMTELSSQFYETPAGFQGSPWARATVVDPMNGREVRMGQKGLLRIVDLANRGSVCAIQTEDLAMARKNGFNLIGRMPQSELRGCSLNYETLLHA